MARRLLLLVMLSVVAWPAARAWGDEWDKLGTGDRYKALRNYWQHEKRPKKERQEVERKYDRWRKMPKDERERVRRNYERLQDLPPEERRRFERKYRKWRDQQE